MANEVYIVVDIETDGPVPGLYSMLSLGAVATTKEKALGEYYEKLMPLDNAAQDPSTMKWWKTQPKAWEEVNLNQKPAKDVVVDFSKWLESFDARLIPVAHPVSFDIGYILWYLHRFTGSNPFAPSNGPTHNLDLSSYIAGKLNKSLYDAHRTRLPKQLFEGAPEHSHNALDDARGYAALLRNILE